MKFFLFFIFTFYFCFSFSYVFDINVGAAAWEKDKKKEVKDSEEIEKINNDIGINFNVNNGILFFSHYLILFGVGYNDRPTFFFFEKEGKVIIEDYEFNLFYFKFLYCFNSYSSSKNLQLGFSYGITEEIVLKKTVVNKVIEEAPTIKKRQIWTLTPEVNLVRRLNGRVNLYLRIKTPLLLEEKIIVYPQANIGLQIEVHWFKL